MLKVPLTYIIDDDYIFRVIATKMLEAHPNYVRTEGFGGGKDALNHIKASLQSGQPLPNLILLDIDMPVMDAWQFLEALRGLPLKSKIQIVAVSSSINPEDLKRASEHPDIREFIPKPLSDERLAQLAASI